MLVATATFISLTIPLQIHSDFGLAMPAITPLSSLSDTPSVGQIKSAISYIAVKYGIENSELMKTIACESSFNSKAKNPHSAASGVAQFMPSTFKMYCKGDYNSAKDQLTCMGIMFKNKQQSHWECWKKYLSS